MICVTSLAAAFGTATAQVASRQTILFRTYQVLVVKWVWNSVEKRSELARVFEFAERPLERQVPTPAALDSVYRSIHDTLRLQAAPAGAGLRPAASAGAVPAPFGATFVTGLVDFLLERARAEVVQSVFGQLDRLFEREPDLAILFPTVRQTVGAAGRLTLRLLVPELRAAGREDLRNLPLHVANPALSLWSDHRVPWPVQVVSAAADPALAIADGTPALVALSTMADLPPDAVSHDGARGALRLVGRVARETAGILGAPTDDEAFEVWLGNRGAASLAVLLGDPEIRSIFVALLLDGITDDPAVRAALAEPGPLEALVARCQQLRDMAARAADPILSGPRPTPLDFLRVAAGALRDGAVLLPDSTRPALERAARVADALYAALAENDWAPLVLSVLTQIPVGDDATSANRARERLQRVVVLAGALAAAESPDAVRDALGAWADPVGGYRARREAGLHVAVVGYLGLAAGREQVRDAAGDMDLWGPFGGAFAPVGLEVAVGLGGASLGVFASLLDVGTLASYRLNDRMVNDSTEISATPEYGVAHVLSPGAWLTAGLTRVVPLAVGIGVQFAPKLREVNGGLELGARNAFRWGAFLAVDLTLFRL